MYNVFFLDCDLDLLFLFDVIDPVDYILLREVVRLERKSKKKVFQLSVIPNDQCIRLFHFDKINIMKLCDALKLPKMCRTAANHRFSGK